MSAAARRTKTFWDRGREGSKLIERLTQLVNQDADVPASVRDQLAAVLPDRIRTEPAVHGALALILDGEDVNAAVAALSQLVGRLTQSAIEWPAGFGAEQFGAIVGRHALDAADRVKATDRDAAHRDHKHTRQTVDEVRDAVQSSEENLLDSFEGGERRIIDAIRAGADDRRAPTDLAHALLVGPLRHVGASEEVERAHKLAERGELVPAAEMYLEIANRLDELKLQFAAESLRERAAMLIAEAGDPSRAIDLLVGIAEARIDRGSRWGVESVAQVLAGLVGEDRRLVDALVSRIAWPEQGQLALDRLRAAFEQKPGGDTDTRSVAAYIDLLSIQGQHQTVIDAAAAVESKPLESGHRLMIELDRLEAMEALGQREAAENGWRKLLRWVDSDGSPADRGIAYQRRGTVFAWRESLDDAEDAFRRAMAAWAEIQGYEEQVGDAFLSMQHAYLINARTQFPDYELRPLAGGLRGGIEVPAAQADRLISEAMSDRLGDRLPNAMQGYWMAYSIQRRTGSLIGMLGSIEALAELNAHAEHWLEAMILYVSAGDGVNAAKAAARLPPESLADRLRLEAPRWERAAVYYVIAQRGREIPADAVAEWASQIIAEAKKQPDGIVAPQPALGARNALAAIALSLPPEEQQAGFEQLRAQLCGSTIDVVRATTMALILSTNVALTDAVDDIVDLFLANPFNLGVEPGWIAERVQQRDDVRDRLRTAAVDGHAGALEVLAMADLIRDDQELIAACTDQADRLAAVVNVTEEHHDGVSTISVGMGIRLEGPAIAARYSKPEARGRLVDRMLLLFTDPREPELNRASAASALFNVAPALDIDEASKISEALQPIAMGRYAASQWDRNDKDRLSRWRLSFHIPHSLRVAALGTIAQLVAKHNLDREPLQQAVLAALADGPNVLVAAALDAVARVPELALPFPPELALDHEDPSVRTEALAAWWAIHSELPPEPMLQRLRADPHPNIRLRLVELAGAGSNGLETLQWLIAHDPDAYVRELARRRFAQIQAT